MNRIREHWKDNGTPFYFHFNDGHNIVHLDAYTCQKYDTVVVDERGLTALDTLVDVSCIYRALQRVDDGFVRSAVLDALSQVVNNTNYIVSLNLNSKSYDKSKF